LLRRELKKTDELKKKTKETKDKGAKAAPKAVAATDVTPERKVKRPNSVHFGLNLITRLVEKKKAKLVIIAHDVDPIELVVWLPALCRKMQVPYCVVKGKSRLGAVVSQKTATALAFTSVNPEHKNDLQNLATAIKENYNDRFEEFRKVWSNPRMGIKSNHAQAKKKRIAKIGSGRR